MNELTHSASSRRALVIGKFMPPHLGHLHLVDAALAAARETMVLVCSLPDEPIPGALRHRWMHDLVPNATVRHVSDVLPSKPDDDPQFWAKWLHVIRREHRSPLDLLVTSEPWGDELAARLGARHLLVDVERRAFPVSGTAIRARPRAHWRFLPPPVQAYYTRRIVVIGSESTGKTVLSAQLAAHYGTVWTPEFARGYLDAKPAPLHDSDIEPIARGQIEIQQRGVRAATRLVFHDTDLVSTKVYAEHYYGRCASWIHTAARAKRAHLYLLCAPDVPWVPDPQRDRPDRRVEMHALFVTALRALRAQTVTLRGGWAERFERAVRAVDNEVAAG